MRRSAASDLVELAPDGEIRLLGGYSPTSGQHHFPRRPVCPYSGADDVEPVTLSDHGTVWGWTAVTTPPPGYRGEVPYGFGIVELPEGLRVVTRLAGAATWTFGDPVRLVADPVFTDDDGTEVVTWAFAPGPPDEKVTPSADFGVTSTPHRGVSDAETVGRRGAGERVVISGVGIHPFGRWGDTPVTDLGVVAVRDALAEAGNPRPDAVFCGTAYSGVAAAHKVMGALACTGMPIVDVEAGCASGGAALQLAAASIRAGQFDTVLVFGMEKMPKGMIRSSFFEPWREEVGLNATPAYFALRAQRLLRESGLSSDDLAAVVVKNRRHGVHNPAAMFRAEVTAQEVLASRPVSPPLHLFMLCSPNEGAAAVVLQRADVGAARADGPVPVTLAAASLRSHLPGSVLGEATPLSGVDDITITPPSTLAVRDVYEIAGLGPGDLDLVECQDTDAARELLAYEELLLCAPGEQRALLADGVVALGGRLPVNPSGGLLSKGEPLGASALGQVVELVHQLRGQAGARQVEGARVGLAHTVGRGANACCVVVTR